MNKPNIIFLMTDQQRWDCLGVLNPHIKTSNLDELAKQGITFSQAVCQCPMCVPSRNSMMYGLYPSQIGVRSNSGGIYREKEISVLPLPEILRREGYQTAGFGKTHWSHYHPVDNPEPSTRGFETRASVGECDHEKGIITMEDVNPIGYTEYVDETKDFGPGEENVKGYIGCTSRIPDTSHRDGFIAEQCLKFLDEDVDPERPLFLYLSFIKPHAGFNVPEEFERLYDINEIPDIVEPEWTEEPDTHLKALFKSSSFLSDRQMKWNEAWRRMDSKGKKRTTLRYYANCTWLDSYFGKVLKRLEELGRLENSLILFVSDHGDMLGERRNLFSKYCLYDGSVRVPMVMAGSLISEDRKGTIDERPVELIDVVPTLMRIAGISDNPVLPGLDLLGDRIREGTFCELHGSGYEYLQPAPSYMWRKKEWKLILYLNGRVIDVVEHIKDVKGELYNLKTDPCEFNNLYYEDEYIRIREQMKTELLMYLASVWARGPLYFDNRGFEKLKT